MKQGLYDSISNDDYHSGPGLSSTGIKLLLECPRKFYNRYVNPAAKKSEDKKECLSFGQAFHSLFLEPQCFRTNYHLIEKIRRNTNAYKAIEQEALAQGKQILFIEDVQEMEKMAESLRSIPVANKAIRDGKAEISGYWIDEESGELLRCRPDYLTDQFILDLKTTRSANPQWFGRDAIKLNYHVQAAFYLDGIRKITGNEDLQFVFLAVEKEPDFISEDFVMDEDTINLGRNLYKSAIKIYQICKKNNDWPSYCQTQNDHVLSAGSWDHEKLNKLQQWVKNYE